MEQPELRRSKRPKTRDSPSPPPPSSAGAAEGSAETGEPPGDPDTATCGICLSDGCRAARGEIDSCAHYFCFVCIMAWAKVESRCPMCKLRFRSIRRAAVPGLFPSDRLVPVPLRDQVHNGIGNESRSISDPYKDINCSYCHSTDYEELLLLCDLCDSAAHTYCVGLGNTVPEGDWFCPDCTISRDQHSKAQLDTDCYDDPKNANEVQVTDSVVSILEIVSDEVGSNSSRRSSNIQVKERNSASQNGSQNTVLQSGQCSSPNICDQENLAKHGARTLHGCRSLHERILVLRKNWNELRAGSLDFSTSLVSYTGMGRGREQSTAHVISDVSRQTMSVTSMKKEQISTEASDSNKIGSSKDYNRAWKMMRIAKSIQGSQRGIRPDHSLTSHGKDKGSKGVNSFYSHSFSSRNLIAPQEIPGRIGSTKHRLNNTNDSIDNRCQAQISEKQKLDKETKLTFHKVGCHGQESMSAQKVLSKSPKIFDGRDKQVDPDFTASSSSGAPSLPFNETKAIGSSNCREVPVAVGLDAGTATSNNSIVKNAKAEIQALVKLNLKLLKDQQLGVDRFKQVARVATHTVLAACGLEHSNSRACTFSSSICSHDEKVKQLRKSNLMPNSCRECFYTFVKDVVDSVVFDKNISRSSC